MVGAIVFSLTDAASQEAVVGSAQRAKVAGARAPRDAAAQQRLEYLGSYHPGFELEGSARLVDGSRVFFQKLHHTLLIRRTTSRDRSRLWLTFPSKCTNSFVWFYTWPAASALNAW